MIYIELFLSFLQIGAFSFGGGYAALPLIQDQVVNVRGWISLREMSDLITISQMTPGPIAINAATFVGNKMAGLLGGAVATLGCIFPSCIVATILAWVYMKYKKMDMVQGVLKSLRPAVVAMIGSAGLSIIVSAFFPAGLASVRIDIIVIFIIAMIILRVKKTSPVAVMLLCGLMEVVYCVVSGMIMP